VTSKPAARGDDPFGMTEGGEIVVDEPKWDLSDTKRALTRVGRAAGPAERLKSRQELMQRKIKGSVWGGKRLKGQRTSVDMKEKVLTFPGRMVFVISRIKRQH